MRYRLIVLLMLLCSATSAPAQVSIGIGLPGVSIGINLGSYPELVRVPGYPVYYAPRLDSNYFFYDGLYWVYEGDDWYESSWYDGPWRRVAPEFVPVYILRIPVRYYRRPPEYFRGWRRDAPPHWGQHWGHEWEQHRRGWDRWDRHATPAPAPLPTYQRKYSGDRYPRVEEQQALHNRNYRYQPRDPVARERYREQRGEGAFAPSERRRQGESPREAIQRPGAPPPARGGPPPREGPSPEFDRGQRRGQARERGEPRPSGPGQQTIERRHAPPPPQPGGRDMPRAGPPQGEERGSHGAGASREPGRGQGQGQKKKDRQNSDERGQERNR